MILLVVIGIFTILHRTDGSSTHHTSVGYLTHYYYGKRPVQVNDSLILELTNRFLPDERKDFLTCDVRVVTSPSRRLLVHFISIEISEDDLDRLHIYDIRQSGEDVRISPVEGLYGVYDKYYSGFQGRVRDFMSARNQLKLDYQGKPTLAYSGFRILLTAFKDYKGSCEPGFLLCRRKNICIPVSTRCDGYQNCGNNDSTDEDGCDAGLANAWKPWDGQVTGVVAAAVACTVFLLTAGVIFFVIMRINKRAIVNTNITIEYRRRQRTKTRQSNRENLTRLYAPPSYEVVVGMEGAPPPYEEVGDLDSSESDEENGILREHMAQTTDGACVCLPSEINRPEKNLENQRQRESEMCVTSVLVTCDIDGNNICALASSIETPTEDVRRDDSKDFQSLTKYKLCASTAEETEVRNMPTHAIHNEECPDTFNAKSNETVSADAQNNTLPNGESESHYGGTEQIENGIPNGHVVQGGHVTSEMCNGHTPNGHLKLDTSNGHVKVVYKRSPSKIGEKDAIEYIDSD